MKSFSRAVMFVGLSTILSGCFTETTTLTLSANGDISAKSIVRYRQPLPSQEVAKLTREFLQKFEQGGWRTADASWVDQRHGKVAVEYIVSGNLRDIANQLRDFPHLYRRSIDGADVLLVLGKGGNNSSEFPRSLEIDCQSNANYEIEVVDGRSIAADQQCDTRHSIRKQMIIRIRNVGVAG